MNPWNSLPQNVVSAENAGLATVGQTDKTLNDKMLMEMVDLMINATFGQ